MKKLNLKLESLFVVFFIGGLTILNSCKKEEPLEPNPDMAKYQTEDYAGGIDFGGIGDTTSNGGDTGGGNDDNGNGNSSPFFRASINGNNVNFPARTYTSTSMGVTINASEGSNGIKEISINLLNQPTIGDTIRLNLGQGMYMEGIGVVYYSKSGYLVFNQIETGYVEGRFAFVGEMVNNPDSTVSITNGEFYINR